VSRSGDYGDEMFTRRFTDSDVEALLSHREPDDPDFADLSRHLRVFDPGVFSVTRADVATFAARAAALARAGEPSQLAATARHRRGLSLTPRLATAAVAAILVLGMTGVAAAANSAAPGDPLYGLDRAMERIGIADGGDQERIDEANNLAEDGQAAAALTLLAETVSESSSADALLRAADRLRESNNGSDTAEDVRSEVADMLEWMSSTDPSQRGYGQGISDRAGEIGVGNSEQPAQGADSNSGGTEGPPGQGTDTTPGGNESPPGSGVGNGRSGGPPQPPGQEGR